MKKLLLLLTLGLILFSCKKTKDPDPVYYYEYNYNVELLTPEITVYRGDTGYINFDVRGTGSFVNIRCRLNDSDLYVAPSQDSGVPPFHFSIIVAPNDSTALGSRHLEIYYNDRQGNGGVLAYNFIYIGDKPIPADTSCFPYLLSSYHFDSASQHQVDITIARTAVANTILLNNIDGHGGTAKAYISCPGLNFNIPFQQTQQGVFVDGDGELNPSNGLITYHITDSLGNIVTHYYYVNP